MGLLCLWFLVGFSSLFEVGFSLPYLWGFCEHSCMSMHPCYNLHSVTINVRHLCSEISMLFNSQTLSSLISLSSATYCHYYTPNPMYYCENVAYPEYDGNIVLSLLLGHGFNWSLSWKLWKKYFTHLFIGSYSLSL